MAQLSPEQIAALPYRPCVGIVLINADGLVFAGRRVDTPAAWQMPQGGIDKGETPREAGLRELREETGVKKKTVEFLAETAAWIPYDLPPHVVGKLWKGRYRGQTQKWIALRFLGEDSDIDINYKDVEFEDWRWMARDEILEKIVDFKRSTYERVFAEFDALFA